MSDNECIEIRGSGFIEAELKRWIKIIPMLSHFRNESFYFVNVTVVGVLPHSLLSYQIPSRYFPKAACHRQTNERNSFQRAIFSTSPRIHVQVRELLRLSILIWTGRHLKSISSDDKLFSSSWMSLMVSDRWQYNFCFILHWSGCSRTLHKTSNRKHSDMHATWKDNKGRKNIFSSRPYFKLDMTVNGVRALFFIRCWRVFKQLSVYVWLVSRCSNESPLNFYSCSGRRRRKRKVLRREKKTFSSFHFWKGAER